MIDQIREQYFPVTIEDGIKIENYSAPVDYWKIASPLMNRIFPPYANLGAYGYAVPEERREKAQSLSKFFGQTHHERFLFKSANDTPIGYSYGSMRDAQTFFMTSTGILADYRRHGIYTAFLKQLLRYLYALGYERVLSNHHPNNRAIIIAKLKAGFNITAVNLDERWGAQVELTYLFHEDRRQTYCRAFSVEERYTPKLHE